MAKFTDRTIRDLKPTDVRREIPVTGTEGLYVIQQAKATGARSFAVRFRVRGIKKKLNIGRWLQDDPAERPATLDPHAKYITLVDARAMATKTLADVRRGKDPSAAKRDAKQEQKKAAKNTLRAISDDYFHDAAGMKIDHDGKRTFTGTLRSAPARYAALERHVFPTIGSKPISDLRRSDVRDLLRGIANGPGAAMADQVLAFLRTILNWYQVQHDEFTSPIVKGMARTKPSERARERVLSDTEIKTVWTVAEAYAGPFGSLIRFLLLTGARRNEAAAMTWSEVDNKGNWLLPAARNKVKVDFLRPLSKPALGILNALPRYAGNPHVFTTGREWFSGFSKAKREFDAAVLDELQKHDADAEPLPNWTPHDLRRTARSLMSSAKVNSDVAEIAIGHKLTGVRGTYDRYSYFDEKVEAFDALARRIDVILNPRAANVVDLKRDAVVA